MFTESDYKLLDIKKISTDSLLKQLAYFEKGFPFAKLSKPATIGDGINALDEENCQKYIRQFENEIADGLDVAKFVPASGAATRMFKSLFEFLQASEEDQAFLVDKEPYATFLKEKDKFAFADELPATAKTSKADMAVEIIFHLLHDDGMSYGSLPKGLLKFHKDNDWSVTPFEEHLREAAGYGKTNDQSGKVHYTVSPEHHEKFVELWQAVKDKYESLYGITYDIDFSFQKPSTDTVAANPDNTPFRDEDGQLVFRPGGHGALIENLNEMSNTVVFIKNIDNVVPKQLQEDTIKYKKVLAGLLIEKKNVIFEILTKIEDSQSRVQKEGIEMAFAFLQEELQIDVPVAIIGSEEEYQVKYIFEKLNRPIRVCGMVKNEGEPGGGPFWVKQADGTNSLQIVEGAQIDPNNEQQQEILQNSTHFNPVDLVCYLKDFKGNKFDLKEYVDPQTGFISEKTLNGKPLKALELPGLWNGAMANWITFFVEVPVTTFNPVKTVMDLLRPQHQPE
nr:DUF4301 family protein [uncultured Carboxylicivirga sp.]